MLYWLEVHALLTLRFYISAQFFSPIKADLHLFVVVYETLRTDGMRVTLCLGL